MLQRMTVYNKFVSDVDELLEKLKWVFSPILRFSACNKGPIMGSSQVWKIKRFSIRFQLHQSWMQRP
jgi:hypothetical protein